MDLSIVTYSRRQKLDKLRAFSKALKAHSFSYEVLDIRDMSAKGEWRQPIATWDYPPPSRPMLSLNRNEVAFFKAKGKYLYFVEAEEYPDPAVLEKMVQSLEDRPDRGVAIAAVEPWDPKVPIAATDERLHFLFARETLKRTRSRFSLLSRLLFRPPVIIGSSCVIRRSVFLDVGGFDPDIPAYEDLDLLIRAIRSHGFLFVDDVVLRPKAAHRGAAAERPVDAKLIVKCYQNVYRSYKKLHGYGEYYGLRVLALVLD